MKFSVLVAALFCLYACNYKNSDNGTKTVLDGEASADTLIVKHKDALENGYQADYYSKAYTYYWLVGEDTLDFRINAAEHKSDSTFHISLNHEKPILFAEVLQKTRACYGLIKEDFDATKLTNIYFKSPIYYLDMATTLSKEYEQKFGQKNVSYNKAFDFMLQASLTQQLNEFLGPMQKKVHRYGIEKFHLLEKQYYNTYLPDVSNFSAYPEFVPNGMGMAVYVERE